MFITSVTISFGIYIYTYTYLLSALNKLKSLGSGQAAVARDSGYTQQVKVIGKGCDWENGRWGIHIASYGELINK